MKRIRIWLNGFSLVQQFFAVALLTVFVFGLMLSTLYMENYQNFVNNQMYSYLQKYEETYVEYENVFDKEYHDSNVTSFIYSLDEGFYISDNIEGYELFLANLRILKDGARGSFTLNEETYVYSIKEIENGQYLLVSLLDNEYVDGFKSALQSGVINFTILIVIALFFFFLLWVVSLISPLNKIVGYVNRIRRGEKAELSIERSDEIGEVAEAIVNMDRELSRAQRVKEELIQNISHDLKTPIATIKSYSESIKDGIYPYDTLEKSVDVIVENATRLEKKVYNLNTFNKLEYLKDSPEETNMRTVIEHAMISVEAIRNDIEVEANIDSDTYFHGAYDPWRIVVENLIDNALRYAKSRVVINLEHEVLEVYNDGQQMEKERIEKLFKPYEKGTKGNFGLGLSIVKKICDTYGYNIVGENTNDGVVFKIYSTRPIEKAKKKGE